MKKELLWQATALMVAVAMTGCGQADSDSPVLVIDPVTPPVEGNEYRPIELTSEEQQMVSGSNDFAFRLFSQARTDGKSQILSPLSITFALGMLNNGAGGETQAQISNVLGFHGSGADSINAFCRKMLTEATQADRLTKVMLASTIFLNKDYVLRPQFVERARTYYDAEPTTCDFSDDQTLEAINQWASDHTEHIIKEVLSPATFNPQAISYLLNAIYFKGVWAEQFSKDDTKEEAFSGTQQLLPTMHMADKMFSYTENDLCQAIRLPYGNGAYAMTILLPREDKTVGQVARSLTAESWEQYRWMKETVYADVKLPRFSSSTDIKLNDIMSALGMPDAFSADKAVFTDFCDSPSHIALMKQVARIDVSEEGTEAAAVTVIGIDNAAGPDLSQPRHIDFHAQRPFIYVISEQSTGAVFFIGQYLGD